MSNDKPQTTNTSGKIGVILELNGKRVPITASDVREAGKSAKESGMDLALPEDIELGSIADFDGFLADNFGGDHSLPNPDELPSPLDAVVKALENATWTIGKFHLHIPGTAEGQNAKRTYTVEMSALLQEGDRPHAGGLKVDGFFFGFSNEGDAT